MMEKSYNCCFQTGSYIPHEMTENLKSGSVTENRDSLIVFKFD